MSINVSSEFSIPPGFRFLPTKEEILTFFLKRTITGQPITFNPLIACEIYGENMEPWKLFDKHAKDSFWVFTRLKRKSKSRIDRVAGCGCWDNETTKDVKDASGKLLGFDRSFTFTSKHKDDIDGSWIMHEFSLLDDKESNDYVICEIKNKDAAKRQDQES